MTAYYNEIDPKAAAWLRELIKQGHIVDGVVDERSIVDVSPDELRGFTQCHFFAGIGVWSYALRSAGWADDRPVWTGSCPCQPFSSAGRRGGVDDERHLWPHWHHLISQCQPAVVFGEQVASKDGLGWLDLVSTDMEATGYAFGAADLCAAGVGAPHIRQRLFFGATRLADAADAGLSVGRGGSGVEPGSVEQSERLLADGGLGNTDNAGPQGHGQSGNVNAPSDGATAGRHSATAGVDGGLADANAWVAKQLEGERARPDEAPGWRAFGEPSGQRDADGLADAADHGREHAAGAGNAQQHQASGAVAVGECGAGVRQWPSPTNGHWRDADWLFCRDGKWRPVRPGTFPLAHGATSRVGRLRAYGNAIVPQAAAEVIGAYLAA